jgi:hypothetical protein
MINGHQPASAAAAIMASPARASGTQQKAASPEPAQDADAFMAHLSSWHQSKLARLRHMVSIPPGTEVEILDDKTGEMKNLTLDGDVLEGFKLGLRMGISEIQQLPFVAEVEGAEAPKEEPSGD